MSQSRELQAFFGPEALRYGRTLVHMNHLRIVQERTLENCEIEVFGKAMDVFNFVNKPRLVIDPGSGKVLDASCDCNEGRFGGRCEHCAALALALMGEQPPVQPGPTETDAPVPEPSPVPAPEPEPEPEQAAPSEPAPEPEPVEVPEQEHRSMRILFGTSRQDGTELIWQPNDTQQVFHMNTGIIGTMGTGKTQFTKSMVLQLWRNRVDNYDGSPFGILIFDYKGDYNELKTDFVEAVDARVLKPYRLPFNPFALTKGRSFKPRLPIHTASEFKNTISKIFRLGPKQQQFLLDCISKAYTARGILPDAPETWDRPAPTFADVYAIYDRERGSTVDSLTAAMNKLDQFSIFESDSARVGSFARLMHGVVVIDISSYDEDIQNLIVAITLDQFYAQMQALRSSKTDGRFRQLRNLILVDEADGFMAKGFSSLLKILKEGREFGVGVILSTQSLSHFAHDSEDYSRYVLTWVVHNTGDLKRRDVEYVFKLPAKSREIEAIYGEIKQLEIHQSIVKISNENPVAIQDKPFWQLVQTEE